MTSLVSQRGGVAANGAALPSPTVQTRYLILLSLLTAALILAASAVWFVGLGT